MYLISLKSYSWFLFIEILDYRTMFFMVLAIEPKLTDNLHVKLVMSEYIHQILLYMDHFNTRWFILFKKYYLK